MYEFFFKHNKIQIIKLGLMENINKRPLVGDAAGRPGYKGGTLNAMRQSGGGGACGATAGPGQAAASPTPLLGVSLNASSTLLRRDPKSSTMLPLLDSKVCTASVLPCSWYRSARLLSAASAE